MLYDPKWETQIEIEPIKPWSKALLNTAELLEQQGWCQYRWCDPLGRYCILGALSTVEIDDYTRDHALKVLRTYLKVHDLAVWNDREGRTVKEVTAKLRQAAQL